LAAHRPKIRRSDYAAAAIIALDPAAVGDCGVAARLTAGLRYTRYETLRAPEFQYAGWVFNPRMHDDLSTWIADYVGKDQRVLLVVENAAYRGTARHLGRAIGCLEGLLHDLNLAHPNDTQYIAPSKWRSGVFGVPLPQGREALKLAAVLRVSRQYGLAVSDDLAEAICMLDYYTVAQRKVWADGKLHKADPNRYVDELPDPDPDGVLDAADA